MYLYKDKDKDRFYAEKGLHRLAYLGTLPRILLILGLFLAIILILNSITALVFGTGTGTFNGPLDWLRDYLHISATILPNAHAATGNTPCEPSPDVFKEYMPLVITLSVCFAFLWSLGVCFHSAKEKNVTAASDITKMLFGFMAGIVTSIIGIK